MRDLLLKHQFTVVFGFIFVFISIGESLFPSVCYLLSLACVNGLLLNVINFIVLNYVLLFPLHNSSISYLHKQNNCNKYNLNLKLSSNEHIEFSFHL